MKPKICVYTIALNEEHHVDRFLQGCQGADLVLICDTGSTDNTVEKLRAGGATVHTIGVKPWRFDTARNVSLSLIPQDFDLCLTIDLDEILTSGWREHIDELWKSCGGDVNRINYDYIWNWKSDGTPDVRFYGDRWHSRHGYIWRHPCHETLYWVGEGNEVRRTVTNVELHHHADSNKSRGQYLGLLKVAAQEDYNNDRTSHYYGRELYFCGYYQEAITELTRHLGLPKAIWNEERAASWGYISKSWNSLGNKEVAKEAAIKGVLECNTTREPWMNLAKISYECGDWNTCLWAVQNCLSIKMPSGSYMSSSSNWGWEPYDLGAISCHWLGWKDKAVEYGKKALELSPDDPRLKSNLEFYESNN